MVAGYTGREEGEYISLGDDPELQELYPPRPDGSRYTGSGEGGREGRFAIGGDRKDLALMPHDEALIQAVAAAQPRTVVGIVAGSAVVMERWRRLVPAIVYLYYGGMEGGHALASMLLGDADAPGRLPFSIPADPAHLPDFDAEARAVTYDSWHGQWKLDRDGNAAALPFGFGLSYTTFALTAVTASATPGLVTVSVGVANRGTRAGSDVVQVYASLSGSRYDRPLRKLAAFTRVDLAPGESRTVELAIPADRLRIWDGGWQLEPGEYRFTAAHFAGDPAGRSATLRVE